MERKIVCTADGSKTIQLTDWNEQYHSLHGAIQEAYHVFIEAGLRQFSDRELSILEVGFVTGLNALITLVEAPASHLKLHYTTLETAPVTEVEWRELGYGSALDVSGAALWYEQLHTCPWEESIALRDGFTLLKRDTDLRQFVAPTPSYDLIYFDAFGPRVQPDLWTGDIFGRMFSALNPGGILVTYSAKGSVRRAMEAECFRTERLPGPPGKREMLRAVKG